MYMGNKNGRTRHIGEVSFSFSLVFVLLFDMSISRKGLQGEESMKEDMSPCEVKSYRKVPFYKFMHVYHTRLRELVDDAETRCPDAYPYGDCPNRRKKCPFKVNYDKGEYACKLGALRTVLEDGDEV